MLFALPFSSLSVVKELVLLRGCFRILLLYDVAEAIDLYARPYRMAAGRVGVPDYRDLVEEKLRAAGELYDFMVDQFNEARTFLIEAAIALLCLLDVLLLLRGR